MNGTQVQSGTATLIAFIAGILAGKGVFGLDTATWVTVLTSLAGVAATLWAVVTTRKTSLVSTVANMEEVKTVELDRSVPGASALAQAAPANVIAK